MILIYGLSSFLQVFQLFKLFNLDCVETEAVRLVLLKLSKALLLLGAEVFHAAGTLVVKI